MDYYIGLMSGTSVDGIDAALTAFEGDRPHLVATYYQPYTEALRTDILTLCRSKTAPLEQFGALDVELGRQFAAAVAELLARAKITPENVRAIGSHGQTVRHRPMGSHPFTLQIGDPNIIAQTTGITTVADFRRRDMAAGGEGAPLVPAFHHTVFAADRSRVVLNIGGIANVTWLPTTTTDRVIGFDTGPGNTLMNAWIGRHLGRTHDEDGQWAASGQVNAPLLNALCADEYCSRPPPKSTGPEYFHLDWLDGILAHHAPLPPGEVQATLCAFTAATIANAVHTHCPRTQEVLVCGGGVHNTTLMTHLARRLAPCVVSSTTTQGVDPDWVEAMAFAWLAKRTLQGLPGNLPPVTGARQAVILGGIYRGNA